MSLFPKYSAGRRGRQKPSQMNDLFGDPLKSSKVNTLAQREDVPAKRDRKDLKKLRFRYHPQTFEIR